MTFEEFDAGVKAAVAKAPKIGKSLKLDLGEGFIHIDMTGDEAVVTNEDSEADTVVTTTIETLDALRKKELNPMAAMMGGKIKIKGDMGLAMKLQGLLS